MTKRGNRPYPSPDLPVGGSSEVAEPSPAIYGSRSEVEALLLVRALLAAEVASRAASGALIEAMLPKSEVPRPVAVLQARRNAEAREALLAEFDGLSSSAVAALAGSRARNKAALAHRWKQEGRIFSVSHRGAEVFPGFQFDDQGQPYEAIAAVVAALASGRSAWELALWFVAANGWLDGRRPVDLLASDPGAVVNAAERGAVGALF